MKTLRPLMVVAALMLILALLPIWLYAYYQVLRIVVCLVAVFGSYTAYNNDQVTWGWVLAFVAIIFNPIAPIHLEKDAWVILDVVAALVLFIASQKLKRVD